MVFPLWNIWRRKRGQRPAGRPAFKPAVEALEQRWVPSTITRVQDLGAPVAEPCPPASPPLTLSELLDLAARNNPDLVAVRARGGVAKAADASLSARAPDGTETSE